MQALTEAEKAELIERCPDEHRWAFAAWLEGERDLAGDLIEAQESAR